MEYDHIRGNKILEKMASSINWRNPIVTNTVIDMTNKEEQKQQRAYYLQMKGKIKDSKTIDGVLDQVEFFIKETALYHTVTGILNNRILELTEHIKQSEGMDTAPKILKKEIL